MAEKKKMEKDDFVVGLPMAHLARNKMTESDFGKANFEGYVEAVKGMTHDGKPIPSWDDLGMAVRAGWIAGAQAVLKAVCASNVELKKAVFTPPSDRSPGDDGTQGVSR